MILIATLMALAAPPVDAVEDEIVVIGQRMAALSVNVGRDPEGRYHCSLSDTTGNARLDDRLCRTATKCVRKGAASDESVKACIDKQKPKLIAQLRRELEAAR